MSSKPGDKAERAAKAAFLQLRPICSAAANIPSVTNFTNLLKALEDVQVSRTMICMLTYFTVQELYNHHLKVLSETSKLNPPPHVSLTLEDIVSFLVKPNPYLKT